MTRFTSFIIAFVVVAASGAIHGVWSGRWGSSAALDGAVARVPNVPLELGGWTGVPVKVDDEAYKRAGAISYWARSYAHPHRSETFLVILMCGLPKYMAVHTPEVCYSSAGFDMLDRPAPMSPRSESGEELGSMWSARFAKPGSLGGQLRLYWGWNADQTWQANEDPRWDYQRKSFLYKLYVSQENVNQETNAAQEFLRLLLPELNTSLFPRS